MSAKPSYQVAVLTGQSDPTRWALSDAQRQFLSAVDIPPDSQVASNFPYCTGSPAYRPVPSVWASLHNGAQYLYSRVAGFRRRHLPALEQLIARRERTVFLAGSCGLELFNNLHLPQSLLGRVRVFAYGPVARRRPLCPHLLVGGRRDAISRWFFPAPDHLIESDHLGYLRSDQLRWLCRDFIAAVASGS
jgi:hypothetical protein